MMNSSVASKYLIFTVILLSLSIFTSAAVSFSSDDVLSDFMQKASSSYVTFSYTYSVDSQVKINGSGTAEVQGNSFYMKSSGMEIWCNGKTKWTVDRASSEAVIESVESSSDDYYSNPARLIGSLNAAFTSDIVSSGTFNGKSVRIFSLKPKSVGNINLLKLYFYGDSLIGASVIVKDGTETKFVISNVRFLGKTVPSHFDFDVKTLDKSYVVTDLR
jgi:hypothetical protein